MTDHKLPGLPSGVEPTRAAQVANRVHSTAIHVLRAAAVDDRRLGLTAERLSLLSVVVFAGPMPVGVIAAAEGISPAAVSRSVAALESAGLVAKSRRSDDSRVVDVAATAKGRRLLDRGRRRRLSNVLPRLVGLSADDLALVERACELLDDRDDRHA